MSELLPEIPRLYTALAEWMACIVFISLLRKKLFGWKLIIFLGGGLLVQSAFLVLTKDLPIAFWIPSMVVAAGMMFGLIYVTCQITVVEAGYFSIRAFVAAELVASLESQVRFFLLNGERINMTMDILLLFAVYGVVFFLIWLLEKRHITANSHLNIRQSELLSTLLIGMAVFGVSNMSFVSVRTPFSGQYTQEILNIRTLVDLGGYAILYAYHIQLNDLRIKHELKAMQNIFQNQYAQYQQSKESIDIINYKYHDLKNQIIALRAEDNVEKRNAYLKQMENDIKSYEAQNKTGNHVLDTLLTSKNLYCIKHGITLTSVANGALLNHMDVIDITTIFGNALDNAIEYEKKIEDKEKRLIHVSVFSQKGFLVMRFENYFEGKLNLKEGIPKTTKRDKNFHGYGLKSIQYAVQKYDGVVNVVQKDSWFELTILMPVLTPQNK